MATIKFYTKIKNHFSHVNTRLLYEFLLKTMFRFCSIFLAFVYPLMLKIFGFFLKYVYRSKSCFAEENGSSFSANRSQEDDDGVIISKNSNGNIADAGDSVFVQSGLISNSNKRNFTSGKTVTEYFEGPKTVKFTVQEMLVESNDVNVSDDQNLGRRISRGDEQNIQEIDEESDSFSFSFSLFSASCTTNEDVHEHLSELGNYIDDEREDDNLKGVCCGEEVYGDKEKLNSDESNYFLEDEDFSYEVELLPVSQFSTIDEKSRESDAAAAAADKAFHEGSDSENWMSKFLDQIDMRKPENSEKEQQNIDHTYLDFSNFSTVDDLENDYIELEPHSVNLTHVGKKSAFCGDGEEVVTTSLDSYEEQKHCRDLDSDNEEEDEEDVLSEHQHLVQQMKMELKNCRIGGLPTISEECESPKVAEDLKPLEIDQKIEYKDIMEEIHKFYKSYLEKMRKLDILNYQTLNAINFLQLKDYEVFRAGKKRPDSVPYVLPKIWARKIQRIYDHPLHKSIIEIHRDLELVYVGQLCLSWEILNWLSVKTQELLEYDSQGNHSYNRAAEEFQQFQVLMQRFMEDEPFQGHRNKNYVRSRCMIRSLLQVPTIKGDCVKANKERREETDAISLETLVEIIRESMLIFREFLFADKRSTNVVLKGVQGINKVDLQEPENSELLEDIISNLQKKDRRIREQIRSQNCIVKKLRKHEKCRLVDRKILASQVELRLVSRVLSVSRLTTDHLVWCKNKLSNINFVGRKVHVEPSFLLFPC